MLSEAVRKRLEALDQSMEAWYADRSGKERAPNWDEYFMSIALLIASRSTCNRLHVGCVLTSKNRVLTTGYNGFLPGAPHVSRVRDNHEQGTVHAEQNAIADAACRGISLADATAYVTHYPCIICFKLLASSGVRTIKYLKAYRDDPLVAELQKEFNIEIIQL